MFRGTTSVLVCHSRPINWLVILLCIDILLVCACFQFVASGNIEGGVPDLLSDLEALQALTTPATCIGGTCKVGSAVTHSLLIRWCIWYAGKFVVHLVVYSVSPCKWHHAVWAYNMCTECSYYLLRFAHFISVDFFSDLMSVLHSLAETGVGCCCNSIYMHCGLLLVISVACAWHQ